MSNKPKIKQNKKNQKKRPTSKKPQETPVSVSKNFRIFVKKHPLSCIERIWAENGFVKILYRPPNADDGVEPREVILGPQKFLSRLMRLMQYPYIDDDDRKVRLRLIEIGRKVVEEAMRQRGEDPATKILMDALYHRHEDGTPYSAEETLGVDLARYTEKYPWVDRSVIERILLLPKLTRKQKQILITGYARQILAENLKDSLNRTNATLMLPGGKEVPINKVHELIGKNNATIVTS